MSYVITKTCEHGTSNPIVARLSVQSRQLMEPFSISREKSDSAWAIIHDKIQPELLNCYDIWIHITNEENRIIDEIERKGINIQVDGRIASIDSIPKLHDSSKAFLHSAHAALREIKSLICCFYDCDDKIKQVADKDYEHLTKWLKKKFGDADEFPILVEKDCSVWLSEVWKKRNTIPHPGGYSGLLNVSNFTASRDSETMEWNAVVPTWNRNDDNPTPITRDMGIIVDNILRFSENILVLCLRKLESILPIIFIEFDTNDRDANCPVRLRATNGVKV